MKSSPISLTSLLLLLPLCALARTATIKVDVDHVIDAVDPRIYGVFMEPIGFNRPEMKFNTLYGPLYDPKSPNSDENGFRKDMLVAARELQLTQMRWPGGNFVANYDWRDGVGPKDKRPKRMDLAWGVVESNQVGTDEWILLNKLVGSENIVCINMGTGTLQDAAAWVQYCTPPSAATGRTCAPRTATRSPLVSSSGAWATRWTARLGSWATRMPTTM